MFFCGEHRLSLDEKGRMRIPNKFRAKLDDEYVIFCLSNDCLFIVSQQEFKNKYERLKDTLISDETQQEAIRQLFATMQVPEEDSQGRFVLQPRLKKKVGITKKMVFLGVMDRIEIWSEEAYDARYATENMDMMQVARTLNI